MDGVTRSGIGRRRGAAAGSKSPQVSFIVVVFSFALTSFVIFSLGYMRVLFLSSTEQKINDETYEEDAPFLGRIASEKRADNADELMSKEFLKWGAIMRADLHLVDIDTHRLVEKNRKNGSYRGVYARFCKLDWKKYKRNPPSFPMFKTLVSASGCDKERNLVTEDLAAVVKKTKEYDKIHGMRDANAGDVHVIPPSGFVFHESRVGSTLVANSLTAMDPEGHRVYSESHPINDALKAPFSDMDANAQLLQDVVYLMGRASESSTEKHMFFKVSSIGSKNINVMRRAFPSVPWIFVYRDPVQAMMSHLDPAKLEKMHVRRGATTFAVCLRARNHPPEDLKQLVADHDESAGDLSYEKFCAAHLATLCESALREMRKSDGKGVAVEYDRLVDKLIENVIPKHFGIDVDEAARQRIFDVAKIYSKSKTGGNKDWVEDSKTKNNRSTPEIREASKLFLYESYSELKRLSINL